jgi:hypothetical protein
LQPSRRFIGRVGIYSIAVTHDTQQQWQFRRWLLLDALIVAAIAVTADEPETRHVTPQHRGISKQMQTIEKAAEFAL